MLKTILKAAARRAGVEIYAATDGPPRWSHTVEDYYPVVPRPRWRRGELPHKLLEQTLAEHRADYEDFIAALETNSDLMHGINHEQSPSQANAPYWNNTWFTALDAAALVNMISWKRPGQYMEIGSGNSTTFARYAIQSLDAGTKLVSIDPQPRREIDQLCDEVIRSPLESCDLRIFDKLESGDILFFDGSHRVFTNSDATVFFFEILPRLRPGIFVQIHDIFLPDDYPEAWSQRLCSEQYILASMLMFGRPTFATVAPIYYICQDEALASRVKEVFKGRGGRPAIPFLYPTAARNPGASFWLRTR